jgi:hypothetical protein
MAKCALASFAAFSKVSDSMQTGHPTVANHVASIR